MNQNPCPHDVGCNYYPLLEEEVAHLRSILRNEPDGTPLRIIGYMFDEAERRGHQRHAARHALAFLVERLDELEGALSGMIEWLDSEPVRDSLSRAASLALTHRHLAVTIPPDFGEWAKQKIAAARAAVRATSL